MFGLFFLFFGLILSVSSRNVVSVSQDLVFVQYNLHLFGGTAEFPVFFHDEERREGICANLLSYEADVISIVEIWSKEYKLKMVECLNEKYPHFQFHETSPLEVGNGLLLLSKYPILNNFTEFVKYKHLKGSDWFAQKGVLGTMIQIPNIGKFRIFITHTQASMDHWNDRKDNLHTAYNFVTQFFNHDLETRDGGTNGDAVTPAILLGDLNLGLCEVYQQEYEYFTALYSKNTFYDSFGISPVCFTPTVDPKTNNMAVKFDGKNYRPERDDFIMVTGTGHWKTLDHGVITDFMCCGNSSCCSDHYPIFSKLQFSNPQL